MQARPRRLAVPVRGPTPGTASSPTRSPTPGRCTPLPSASAAKVMSAWAASSTRRSATRTHRAGAVFAQRARL